MINIDVSKGIKVGGFDFSVDTDDRAKRMLRGNANIGECDLLNHIISLETSIGEQATSKVFIHEVIEAVNNIYCDNKLDHEKIQQLSFGIHQVIESLGVRFGIPEGKV